MIRFLRDMCVPRRAADALVAVGFDAVHIAAMGRPRDADERTFSFARDERRPVVTVATVDSVFARILASGCIATMSRVVVRVRRPPIR